MKLESKKKEVAGKMSLDFKINHRKPGFYKRMDEDSKHYDKQKGKASLNPPHKGRDNEVMEGKDEKELN